MWKCVLRFKLRGSVIDQVSPGTCIEKFHESAGWVEKINFQYKNPLFPLPHVLILHIYFITLMNKLLSDKVVYYNSLLERNRWLNEVLFFEWIISYLFSISAHRLMIFLDSLHRIDSTFKSSMNTWIVVLMCSFTSKNDPRYLYSLFYRLDIEDIHDLLHQVHRTRIVGVDHYAMLVLISMNKNPVQIDSCANNSWKHVCKV